MGKKTNGSPITLYYVIQVSSEAIVGGEAKVLCAGLFLFSCDAEPFLSRKACQNNTIKKAGERSEPAGIRYTKTRLYFDWLKMNIKAKVRLSPKVTGWKRIANTMLGKSLLIWL